MVPRYNQVKFRREADPWFSQWFFWCYQGMRKEIQGGITRSVRRIIYYFLCFLGAYAWLEVSQEVLWLISSYIIVQLSKIAVRLLYFQSLPLNARSWMAPLLVELSWSPVFHHRHALDMLSWHSVLVWCLNILTDNSYPIRVQCFTCSCPDIYQFDDHMADLNSICDSECASIGGVVAKKVTLLRVSTCRTYTVSYFDWFYGYSFWLSFF